MKRFKKILCFVLPLVLVVVVALGIILPVSLAEPKPEGKEPGPKFVTAYAGQVAYAAEGTGAASADKSEKGGAYYLDEGTSITHTGGTITGKSKTYGGAVYISNKATFTMNGGTISSCQAMYGGAIYVAAGGKCVIKGGTIVGNKAQVAPAIYVETGGTLEVADGVTIENNTIEKWVTFEVSEGTEEVGQAGSGLQLHTATFGSYPQTYVGDSQREEMESWFANSNPSVIKTLTMVNGTAWEEYNYNGELYVRGQEKKYDSDSIYRDGTSPTAGRYSWFKVEPIKWYILNYDEWQNGEEEVELFATQILAANCYFNSTTSKGNSWETSDIRAWCNDTFYADAFNSRERSAISLTTVKNNVTGNYSSSTSDGSGEDTQDHIYLKSYYEMSSGMFTNAQSKKSVGTDFAIGNNIVCASGTTQTLYGTKPCSYWLRSAGSAAAGACYVGNSGNVYDGNYVYDSRDGVRPALQLNV